MESGAAEDERETYVVEPDRGKGDEVGGGGVFLMRLASLRAMMTTTMG